MAKLQRKIKITDIVLVVIVIFLIIINLILYTKKFVKPIKQNQTANNTQTTIREEKSETVQVPQTNEEVIKYLSGLNERERIEYYCGKYFKHLEKKEYELAYNMLYSDFKLAYFPTLEKYEEYIKKTYPSNWALEYNDITRQGKIYVLKLNILDIFGSKENTKSQRIVIQENDYNNFVLSFQVI